MGVTDQDHPAGAIRTAAYNENLFTAAAEAALSMHEATERARAHAVLRLNYRHRMAAVVADYVALKAVQGLSAVPRGEGKGSDD